MVVTEQERLRQERLRQERLRQAKAIVKRNLQRAEENRKTTIKSNQPSQSEKKVEQSLARKKRAKIVAKPTGKPRSFKDIGKNSLRNNNRLPR